MNVIVLFLALPVLSVLPGVWLAFGLPLNALPARIRLALAVAFSPAVIGVQFAALKAVGVPADLAAILLLLGNLPSLWLLRRLRVSLVWPPTWPSSGNGVGATALLTVGLITVLGAPWLLFRGLRTFSWHALMHTDIVYRLAGSGRMPEEPELGGIGLSFAWMPHAYWTVLGILSDLAPTLLYPMSNIIWLLVCAYLIYEIAARGLRLRHSSALVCTGLALLGTQVLGYSVRILANDKWLAPEFFNNRISTVVQKFRGFETMPFGFALFLSVLLVIVWRLRSRLEAPGAIEGSLLLALGVVYPVLFPAALIAAGSQVLLVLTHWGRDLRPFDGRELGWLIAGISVATAAILPVYYLYTYATQGPLPLAFAGRQTKTVQAVMALLPLALLALPSTIRALQRRQGVTALLLWSSVCCAALFVVASLGGLEYKYVLIASLLLAPVGASTVDWFAVRFPRWEWPLAMGVLLLLMGIELTWTLRLDGLIPPNLDNAPQVTETHFGIRLAPNNPNAGWVQAVRDNTQPDTLLVATQTELHPGPFVRRSLYAPSDLDGAATTGYSVDSQVHLVDQRRYPAQTYAARVATVAALMMSEQPEKLAAALETMLAQQRPLAILFRDPATPALRWLQSEGIGRQLFADSQHVIWYIESLAPDASSG